MPGEVGLFLREFGITLAAAIAISAVVSSSLTPMLCSRLLPSGQAERRTPHALLTFQPGLTATATWRWWRRKAPLIRPRADLALLADVATELADVLVVDLVDLALQKKQDLRRPPVAGARRFLPRCSVFCAISPRERNVVVGAAAAEVGVRPTGPCRHKLVTAAA